MAFDAKQLFNQDTYSDITIRFGEREIKCHKIILCSASISFTKQFGKESAFKESEQRVIELKDDPEEAIEAVIRHIYGFNYHDTYTNKHSDPSFHLDVMVTANKYMMSSLEQQATTELISSVANTRDPEVLLKFYKKYMTCDFQIPAVDECMKGLQEQHLLALMRQVEFRAQMENDSSLLELVLKKIEFAYGWKKELVLECATCESITIHRRPQWRVNQFCTNCKETGQRMVWKSYFTKQA